MRFTPHHATLGTVLTLCTAFSAVAQVPLGGNFARDPKQPIDQSYTDRIHKYTTEPRFLSPLVEYLPASSTVPTPEKVLGYLAGAPDMFPYEEDVYKNFRLHEKSSNRVKGRHYRPDR